MKETKGALINSPFFNSTQSSHTTELLLTCPKMSNQGAMELLMSRLVW